MVAVRNILIVALLAAGVAFLPNGGNVADAVLTAITMGFLAVIAWTAFRLMDQFSFSISMLPESRKVVLYASLGLIVLMIAGASKMWSTGLGTLAWLLLIGSAFVGIWLVVSEAREA